MRRVGLAGVALAVGCFGGMAFREVVFPARAASGPTFGYKVVTAADLVETVRKRNPAFADADKRTALEEGLAGFGRAGWRYAGCLQNGAFGGMYGIPGGFMCDQLIFEQGAAAGSPPIVSSAATSVAPTAIEPPTPNPAMHH